MARELITFETPKFEGDRFAGHTLPVDVLPSLTAYSQLILEVAKKLVRDDEKSTHVPRGFEQKFELSLAGVDEGSARIPLKLLSSEFDPYFAKAGIVLGETVACLNSGKPLPAEFPHHQLPLLQKFGGVLRSGETITLRGTGNRSHVFSLATLETVKQATAKPIRKTIDLECAVIGVDDETPWLRIRHDGGSGKPRFARALRPVVDAVVARRAFTRVIAQVDALVDAVGSIVKVAEVFKLSMWTRASKESVEAVEARVETLFLDSTIAEEFGLERDALVAAQRLVAGLLVEHGVPRPGIFPGEDGALRFEWVRGGWDVSVDVELKQRTAYFHALNHSDGSEVDEEISDLSLLGLRAQIGSRVAKYVAVNERVEVAIDG